MADGVETPKPRGLQILLDAVVEAGEAIAMEEVVARPDGPDAHQESQPGKQFVADGFLKPPVLGDKGVHPRLVVTVRRFPAFLPTRAPVLVQPRQDSVGATPVLCGYALPV
ncbi:hypothetical protein [Mycolicibacterium fortuitum]|uniref:hypothetical protein n=1 Tax=Mycolicibacterium fortuitum TaxID=1766 RepID=UPI0029540BFE|nr:hypothetical protein [Mycolicibacterium fortuitum]MDV7194490.1 hypothetical protein [Mycolicibacterium fortuitum]MDV7229178.1 hypothetical protein [Mycolicibacterium fortuitum]MDV7330169.1 hypothetical protein [Mycolicibacterium fortuitum]